MKKLFLFFVLVCSSAIFAETPRFSHCQLQSISDKDQKTHFPKNFDVYLSTAGAFLLSWEGDDVKSPVTYLDGPNEVHDGYIASTPELPIYEVPLWNGNATAYYLTLTTLAHGHSVMHIDYDFYHLQGKYSCQ